MVTHVGVRKSAFPSLRLVLFDSLNLLEVHMPIFMIERHFADKLDVTTDVADHINRINDQESIRWLYSFLSADKRKTYCLYEAPSAEAISKAAARAGIPADVIMELSGQVDPDGSFTPA